MNIRPQAALNVFKENPKSDKPGPAPNPEKPAATAPDKEGTKPLIPQLGSIDDYGSELAEYIVWFCSDGVLHSDDEIFEAVFEKLPFSRRRARIVSRIQKEVKELRSLQRIN